MAISRAQLLKELLPGLNALFGLEYARYGEEHKEVYETETSERSFEEETKLSGFSAAPVKNEGSAIAYDNAQEAWTTRYNHETIALGFSITEEAIEDNLYDSLSARYTKGLARAMAYTKQVKAAAVLNNAFTAGYVGGDGVTLCSTAHPLISGGTNSNRPSTGADLNETSLEAAVIQHSSSFNLLGVRHSTSQAFGVTSRQAVIQVVFDCLFRQGEAQSNGFVVVAGGPSFLSIVISDGRAFVFDRCSREARELGLFFERTLGSLGFVDFLVLFAIASVLKTEQRVQAREQLFQ